MRTLPSFFLSLILITSCSPRYFARIVPGGEPLIFSNARVLLPDCSGFSLPLEVWIERGTITRSEPMGNQDLPRNARVITLDSEEYLIPGLMDLHTHIASSEYPPWVPRLPSPRQNLERFLYAGITTILDLGASESLLKELARKLNTGEIAGPSLFYSGPHIGPRGGHPAEMVRFLLPWPLYLLAQRQFSFMIETEADVMEALETLKEAGATWVKIPLDEIPLGSTKLTPEMVHTIVQLAHSFGFRVAMHIGTNADLRVALRERVDLIAHNVYREPIDPELVKELARSRIPLIPTIGIFYLMAEISQGRIPDDPLVQEFVPLRLWERIRHLPPDFRIPKMESWFFEVRRNQEQLFTNARTLAEAGAYLVLGSDSPFAAWPPGVATHLELDYLSRAGIPPKTLLSMAICNPAQVLGLSDRGSIAPGKRADLVVIKGNPLEDPRSLHAITRVIHNGKIIERISAKAQP